MMADDSAAWESTLSVDVMAAVRASQKVAPWMGETGGGAIVHISSIAGLEAGGFPPLASEQGGADQPRQSPSRSRWRH